MNIDWYSWLANISYYTLYGVGWCARVVGVAFLLGAAFALVSRAPQNHSPYLSCVRRLLGGVGVLQAQGVLSVLSETLFPVVETLAEGDLERWFAFELEAEDASVKDRIKDAVNAMAATAGYCMFVWGIVRLARMGQPDNRGSPISMGSGVAVLAAGVFLTHLPAFIGLFWSGYTDAS